MIYVVEELAHAVLVRMKSSEEQDKRRSTDLEEQAAKESTSTTDDAAGLPQNTCQEVPSHILTNLGEASFQVGRKDKHPKINKSSSNELLSR